MIAACISNIILCSITFDYVEKYADFKKSSEYETNVLREQLELHTSTIERQDETIKKLKKNVEKMEIKVGEQQEVIESKNKTIQKQALEIDEMRKKNSVSRSSSPTSVKRTLSVTATAYTSSCTGCSGITATGIDVRSGIHFNGQKIIAVDPDVIPLHSIVRVYPKDREPFIAHAKDTGGAIKGNKIDFLISTSDKNAANQFGRQENVKVEILRIGK